MSVASGTIPPPISWAQRNDLLYVIIDVECKDIEHKVTENSLQFKGINTLDASKKYDITLNFYKPINPERVTTKNIGRCLEFTIFKKESGGYWPTLTSDKTKLHFIKANFSKWKNESDEEDDNILNRKKYDDLLYSENEWKNKFEDFNVDDDDSDDNIPSLSQNDEDDEDEEKDDKDEKGEKNKEKTAKEGKEEEK